MRALLAIPMLIGLLWPVVVLADITGKPRIIDGDTLEIAGERIRLHGIDAPESGQTCVADGKRWHCGVEASSALAFKIARGWVTCQGEDRDRYGRVIAVCYAGGVGGPELNAWLVSATIRREARAPTLCESVPREFPGGRPQPDPWVSCLTFGRSRSCLIRSSAVFTPDGDTPTPAAVNIRAVQVLQVLNR